MGVLGQPGQVARGGDRCSPQAAGVLDRPRGQTADEGHEQQHVDGGEPEAGEHVEGLQLVQPRTDEWVRGQVVVHLGGVEATLRQQGPGYGSHQQQQHQRQCR
ncbi:hypothetical protein J113_03740 [Mycobacterium tuberculosis CAS/NITR204]|uniref:Uncharacterized protein n=1 Tax=Mycobacterium tuberculosis CAS/NITR204 TaxID=1310114 RepID=R4M2Y7_MYCTX|nr:hypothetical protein J113_03740 [Mycobacterium tuberculosis CAS/NITR204]